MPTGSSQPIALIIDDGETDAALLQTSLDILGWRTRVASSALSAFNRLSDESYDLILLNNEMPIISGEAILEWINERLAERPPIIVISSDDSERLRERFWELGCWDLLTKPVSLIELHGLVNRMATGISKIRRARS